ncbi:hypothetical protein [Candidatus Poriferisodalis sp.]|uniref:hypothetical protein n=1 Tax=Candidatus Poriferisodalis sp. TaxID=3101277 RepID=UPI003B5B0EAB
MSTIATMPDEEAPAASAATSKPSGASHDADGQNGTGRRARSLTVPMPTAITAALIAGMFGLLFLNLNGLRDDIDTLRADMNRQFDRVDQRFEQVDRRVDGVDARLDRMETRLDRMDDRFDEVQAVLLDHTDRLARIEKLLDLDPRTGNASQ